MPSPSPRRYHQLQPEDRVALASLVQQKFSVRQMDRAAPGSLVVPSEYLQAVDRLR